jgi:hypothetical protein
MITLGQVAGSGVGSVMHAGDRQMGEEGMDCALHSSGVTGRDDEHSSGSRGRDVGTVTLG